MAGAILEVLGDGVGVTGAGSTFADVLVPGSAYVLVPGSWTTAGGLLLVVGTGITTAVVGVGVGATAVDCG